MKFIKVFIFIVLLVPTAASAADRSTFFLSAGYNHNLMFTTDSSLSAGDGGNVSFGGGYGFFIEPGYQGSGRWGVYAPLRFTYHNRPSEGGIWYFGININPIVKFFVEPKKGWDPYFAFGAGVIKLSEGDVVDSTSAWGINGNVAIGFDYHFNNSVALKFEVPYYYILFIGDNLSSGTTGVHSSPISLGVTWKFQ